MRGDSHYVTGICRGGSRGFGQTLLSSSCKIISGAHKGKERSTTYIRNGIIQNQTPPIVSKTSILGSFLDLDLAKTADSVEGTSRRCCRAEAPLECKSTKRCRKS